MEGEQSGGKYLWKMKRLVFINQSFPESRVKTKSERLIYLQ